MNGRRRIPSTAGASITPARSRAALSFALATLSFAACHLEDNRSLTLQLSAAGNCVRTSLACGGELGVFVVDSMTDEVLDSRCVPLVDHTPDASVDAALTLEKLPGALEAIEPPFATLPPGRSIAVEVAVYSPVPASGHCPRYAPNGLGNAAVPSYFGRSGAAVVGAATSIGVSLSCLPSKCLACTKYVSPAGADSFDGGPPDGPYKTVGKLVASLAGGQTGCLEDGTYVENVTFAKGGSGSAPVTLAAAPGAHPVLRGVLTVNDNADNIAIVNLTLEGPAPVDGGTRPATPLVRGDKVALRGNDITNAGADCVTLGDPTFGVAKGPIIEGNRIHGCKAGVVARVAESGLVAHNFIFDNTGDGVSLFPNGDSFTIEHNVIDGNGSGVLFGSDGKTDSINDAVRLNVISSSLVGFNVYSMYPMTVGTGNSVQQNCLWMGAKGDFVMPTKGFSQKDNVLADPGYLDRAAKDFRLRPDSPCRLFGPLR